MADEEVEVKTEPPFAVKAVFVVVFVCLFLACPFYTCFFDSPSEVSHDFLDRVVEFYGIEKSEVKAYLFYITLFLGTLTIMVFMMLLGYSFIVIECTYSFLFDHLVIARSITVTTLLLSTLHIVPLARFGQRLGTKSSMKYQQYLLICCCRAL